MRHIRLSLARVSMRPFELLIFFLLLISAAKFVRGAPAPGSVDATFPPWLRDMWGWELFTGAILSIVGLIAGKRRTLAVGLWLIAGVAAFYAIAISYQHYRGFLTQAIADFFLVGACIARAAWEWKHRR